MNVGWLSQALPYLPSHGGFRLYGANLILCLSRRGHQIDLISYLEDGDEQHLDWPRQFCQSVETVPRNGRRLLEKAANAFSAHFWGRQLHGRAKLDAWLRSGLQQRKWGVLHVEGAAAAGVVPPDLPIAKVLSVHDSWTLRISEMLKCPQSLQEKLYYTLLKYHEPRYERLVYPRYDAVTVVAEPDLQAIRKVVPNARVVLIPYGTDTDFFHPLALHKTEATLVFHSHLGYAPNVAAAVEFADEIFPLVRKEVPNAVFHLIGANPAAKVQDLAARPGIKISANLPDLRSAVCSGRIYVCAIRYGTGLKSKMLEAMAMRMPIVAYHPGSTVGITCVHGKHLLAAETPQEFAAHVVELLRHPEKAERLAAAGRELVEQKYSWESRARLYEDLYEHVIHDRTARKIHTNSHLQRGIQPSGVAGQSAASSHRHSRKEPDVI